MKFHQLTVIAEADKNKQGKRRCLFRCDCGVEKIINLALVKNGHTKSCGCLRKSATFKKKLSDSLKKKYASGTRKKNGPEGYAKSSASHKELYTSGARKCRLTIEDCKKGAAARGRDEMMVTNRRIGDLKIGKLNPPGPSAASPDNWGAKFWQLKAPDQTLIEGYNLSDLVRTHAHLFDPGDLVWANARCRASSGLRSLFEMHNGVARTQSWKGWMIGDKMTRAERET